MRQIFVACVVAVAALAACGDGADATQVSAPPSANIPAQTAASTPSLGTPTPVVRFSAPQSEKLDRSSSLGGPDKDSNGVRDDVDEWINTQPFTPAQKNAMTRAAQALQQSLLIDASDRKAALAVSATDGDAMDCVYAAFERKSPEPHRLLGQLEAITANTEARTRQYLLYNHALSGTVSSVPSEPTCK